MIKKINTGVILDDNNIVEWINDGDYVNSLNTNRPIKQTAAVVNKIIDKLENTSKLTPPSPGTEGMILKSLGDSTEWIEIPSELPLYNPLVDLGKSLNVTQLGLEWIKSDYFPDQTENEGKLLGTDGSNVLWVEPQTGDGLPTQTGNSGKYLTTNGNFTSWNTIFPEQSGNEGSFLKTDGVNVSWSDTALPDIPETFVSTVNGFQGDVKLNALIEETIAIESDYVSDSELKKIGIEFIDQNGVLAVRLLNTPYNMKISTPSEMKIKVRLINDSAVGFTIDPDILLTNDGQWKQIKDLGVSFTVLALIGEVVITLAGSDITTTVENLESVTTQHSVDIQNNTTIISGLTTGVQNNTSNIADLTTSVQNNTSNISGLTSSVQTNTTNISDLSSSIQTNTTNISDLSSSIQTNTTNISDLSSSIQTNTDSINAEIARATNAENTLQNEINNLDPLPSQAGNAGKFLTTNGYTTSWSDSDSQSLYGDVVLDSLVVNGEFSFGDYGIAEIASASNLNINCANGLGYLSVGNSQIKNLATPTLGNDAVNKSYVDSLISSSNTNSTTSSNNEITTIEVRTEAINLLKEIVANTTTFTEFISVVESL